MFQTHFQNFWSPQPSARLQATPGLHLHLLAPQAPHPNLGNRPIDGPP